MQSGLIGCTVTPSYTSLWGALVILLLGFIRPSRELKYLVYTLGCIIIPLYIVLESYRIHSGSQFYWLGISASAILLALSFSNLGSKSIGYVLKRVGVGIVLPIVTYITAYLLPNNSLIEFHKIGVLAFLSPYLLIVILSFLIKKENRLNTIIILLLTISAMYTAFITLFSLI